MDRLTAFTLLTSTLVLFLLLADRSWSRYYETRSRRDRVLIGVWLTCAAAAGAVVALTPPID